VAYSWRQERLARDATAVLEVGRTVHTRLTTLSGHLTRLGSALGSTLARYNEAVGSYENSVLVAARRFDDLGVSETPVPTPPATEGAVRALRSVPSDGDAAPARHPSAPGDRSGADEPAAGRDGTTG
jgi:DNA recombination protein RmuC